MPLDPILRTKLFIPPFRAEYVARPHLLDRINAGIKGKLVFVFAPAGYGKTTLIAEWTRQSSLPTAWLSLDHTDRDPITFYQYLIASLRTIIPTLGEGILISLGSAITPPKKTLVTALINEILEHADDFTLVLDDFHRLTNPDVIQILDAIIDDLPPQMHMIIASRSDLPFSYARMRSQGEVITIGIDDLRFKPQEVTKYLRAQLGNQLNSSEEEILRDRSEGWIAGLHMAVLSLQSSHDLHKDVTLFSGQDRYVSDYLVDEVLSRQSSEVYQFLIQTSILDKFTAELCNQVTGLENSQAILDYLDRSGLFVIPLDNTRTWYRYHHLFIKLLRNRLKEQQPGKVAELHGCAAKWFERYYFTDDAIEHWLAAGDYEHAVGYLQDRLDEILAKGKFAAFLNWLDKIPNSYLINNPKLILYQLFQLWEMGYLEKYNRQLHEVEKMMGPIPESPAGLDPETAGYYGIFAVIKCLVYASDYNIPKISELWPRLFVLIPEEFLFWRVMANGAVGFCNRVKGNYAEATPFFTQAIELASKSGLLFPYFMYTIARALVYLETGQLTKAMESCNLPLSLETRQNYSIPFSGLAHAVMGELLYLSGDLAAAKETTWRGIELITNDGEEYSMANAFFTLAQILASQGDPAGAIETMDIMMHRLHDMQAPTPAITIGQAYQAYIWAQCDCLEPALVWAQNPGADQLNNQEFPKVIGASHFGIYCTIHEPFSHYYQLIQIILARVEMASGDYHAALNRLDLLLSQVDEIRSVYFRSQVYILKALVLSRMGSQGQEITLMAAIRPVVNEPCYQLFIREGKPMRSLLEMTKDRLVNKTSKSAEAHQMINFIEQTLGHLSAEATPSKEKPNHGPASYGITPRESLVLEHLSHGVSYEEIARLLTVSPNTVKTHINRIYKKMGVTNRLQAVNKARELGWII